MALYVASLHIIHLSHSLLPATMQILQHSNIKILSDDIYFDILPGETDKKSKKQKNTVYVTKESSKLPSFAAGIGVGIGLMALLTTIIK